MITRTLTLGKRNYEYEVHVDKYDFTIEHPSGIILKGKRYDVVYDSISQKQHDDINERLAEYEREVRLEGKPYEKNYE